MSQTMTNVSGIIPSYVYQEYSDDDALQAFSQAYNTIAQWYLNWFNEINLPVWTNGLISGTLLDWVGQGVYGIPRPVFTSISSVTVGPIASFTLGLNPIAARTVTSSGTATVANDDFYKRVMTWILYTGDGQQFSIRWLKRRIARFLHGPNGVDPGISTTYDIHVTPSVGAFAITLPHGPASSILAAAFSNQILPLPLQYTYTITVS